MSKIRKWHHQMVIYFFLVLACLRVAIARALPSGNREDVTSALGGARVERSLLLRIARPWASERNFRNGVEISRVFPYLRWVSIPVEAASVPMEATILAFNELKDESVDYALTRRVQSPDLCKEACGTSTSCGSCACTGCTGCTTCSPTTGGGPK